MAVRATRRSRPFLAGRTDGRTTAIGLEVDNDGHLFVAGGATGFVFVYDELTGALLAKLSGGSSPTFINDIAVDRNGVGVRDGLAESGDLSDRA